MMIFVSLPFFSFPSRFMNFSADSSSSLYFVLSLSYCSFNLEFPSHFVEGKE